MEDVKSEAQFSIYKVSQDKIYDVQNLLNERIAGLSLEEIRNTFADRFADLKDEKTGVVRFFIESLDKIFSETRELEKFHISGIKSILQEPEFLDSEHMQAVIELIEDKEIILHIFNRTRDITDNKILVSIGKENDYDKLSEFSVVTTKYKFGDGDGVIGMIGPIRMDYSKVIAIVAYMSNLLTDILRNRIKS